jgi:glutamate-ammonia-ligase adenylyltransferase
MPNLSQMTKAIPDSLKPLAAKQWAAFLDGLNDDQKNFFQDLVSNPEQAEEMARVWLGSDFAASQCLRTPELLIDLLASGDLGKSYSDGELGERLQAILNNIQDEAGLHSALRRFRQREMVRIIWRDLLRNASMQETTKDLSLLADAAINLTLDWLYQRACLNWGTPMSMNDGVSKPQQMVVLGMGKLGAFELNLSSDIDLIFTFEHKGYTQGGKRELDNQTFFIRLGQQLIKALDERTAEGFVFRVDMRLRPYGQSGALVLSFDAMLEYYQTQGRDWERYAMIKARVVAGDIDAGARLLRELRPFVYRRYLDFGAIEALRSMKALIRKETQRRGLQDNIKLGSGGIREIEFIAQVFQLIRGGKVIALQARSLQEILSYLGKSGLLPGQEVERLQEAYVFLRNTEHALQAMSDEQTQQLPESEMGQARLAFSMGFSSSEAFHAELREHRKNVCAQFNRLISSPERDENPDAPNVAEQDVWQALWQSDSDRERSITLLAELGFSEPEEAMILLDKLRTSRKAQALQTIARERLEAFLPLMIQAVAETPSPQQTLGRVLVLVGAVLRRSAYLVLLVENPMALKQLVTLCSASPWVSEELARYPILLDELLDVNGLYSPSSPQVLIDELNQLLLRIEPGDVEQQMDCLRNFKRAHVLRVAASEIGGVLPLMKVSDYLTYIAEAVVFKVFQIAWDFLVAKHGHPQKESQVHGEPDFIVVAYGKLGGLELGYGSDLDLVFLHDAPLTLMTDGDRPIDNASFFTRLVQRMLHMFSTYTAAGQLYEIDMRLRPSGSSGLIVSSIQSFATYQAENAWTWEHQALVRTRVIAGSDSLRLQFEALRAKILSLPRNREELRKEVVAMRKKIRDEHGSTRNTEEGEKQFHLKYDEGAIVDIEFIVQYAVLAWSQTNPELLQYPDNIRILDAIETKGLMASEDTNALREAYKAFRSVIHRLTLDQRPASVLKAELKGYNLENSRKDVERIWQQVMIN